MNNLKIATRSKAAFALLTAMLVGVAALALWQMGVMRASSHELATKGLPSVEWVNQMKAGASDFRMARLRHVLNTDDSVMAGIEKTMADGLAAFEQRRKAYAR